MPEKEREKILLITRNLPPLVGGMERLNWHIADSLSNIANVHVIGPEGASARKPPLVSMTEVSLRPLWRFLLVSAWRAASFARRARPNVVLAGSGLTAPAARWAARSAGARSAVYVHGLDVAVRHFLYRQLWYPAILGMDVVVANSEATAELVRELGVDERKIRVVHPGVAIPIAPQPDVALQSFRDRHSLGRARILLSIGRLTCRKGLREFVQHAMPAIVKQVPDVMLVVVGGAPEDALLAHVQSPYSIRVAAEKAGVAGHLRFLGVITDPEELACAYESSAVHVFPVRQIDGDPEGFGMVAIESAAHGIPTVAFATGGIVDAVSEGISGRLVPAGDYGSMARVVGDVLASPDAWSATARAFAERFGWPSVGKKLSEALDLG